MDGLLGRANNPRTIYHQLQAVRMLLIGNVDGVQAHNKGLIQMVAAKHDRGPETEALMGLANM
ncbi:hypothetical protein PoHVEF18_004363 [Penicillium ochrochloron]